MCLGLDSRGNFPITHNVKVCGDSEADHDVNVKAFLKAAEKYNLTFNADQSIIKQTEIRLLGFEVSKAQIKTDYNPLEIFLPQKTKRLKRESLGCLLTIPNGLVDFLKRLIH